MELQFEFLEINEDGIEVAGSRPTATSPAKKKKTGKGGGNKKTAGKAKRPAAKAKRPTKKAPAPRKKKAVKKTKPRKGKK